MSLRCVPITDEVRKSPYMRFTLFESTLQWGKNITSERFSNTGAAILQYHVTRPHFGVRLIGFSAGDSEYTVINRWLSKVIQENKVVVTPTTCSMWSVLTLYVNIL